MSEDSWDYEWTEPGCNSFSFTTNDGAKVYVKSCASVSNVEGENRTNQVKRRIIVQHQSNGGMSVRSYSYSSSKVKSECE